MARITEEQKKQINELYYTYQNKTRVAKELGISTASVTRYLIDGYKPCDKIEEKKCEQKPSYVKLNYDKVNNSCADERHKCFISNTFDKVAGFLNINKANISDDSCFLNKNDKLVAESRKYILYSLWNDNPRHCLISIKSE